MDIRIISVPWLVDILELCVVIMLMIRKLFEVVNILPENTSTVEDTLVDSDTPIIKEVHVSSDSTSDDVDELVEFSISAVLVSHSTSLVLNMSLWSFLLSYFLASHLSYLS